MKTNNRKIAFMRAQEILQQKVNNTIITTPVVRKPRVRTDEVYCEMMEQLQQEVENKMITLSRWNGEGSLWKYREYLD